MMMTKGPAFVGWSREEKMPNKSPVSPEESQLEEMM